MYIVRSTSFRDGLVIREDWDFFGGFGENGDFFLVMEGGMVEGLDFLDWTS